MFLLEKSTKFEISSINPKDLIQCLWHEHIFHTHFLPKSLKIKAFNIISDACFQVPVYKMKFPKDFVDWDIVKNAM